MTGPDRLSTTRDSMTMKRIGISQEWLSRGKRDARSAAAEAAAQRESIQVQAALAETRLQTALAYVDAFYAGEALKLTTLMEHHAHEELEAARGRLASSTGGSQEVLALTAARGTAEDESAQVRQEQSAVLRELAAMDRTPGSEDLLPPPEARPPTEEEYVAGHPSVLALSRELEVAKRQAAVTASERDPNWTWASRTGSAPATRTWCRSASASRSRCRRAERQDRDTPPSSPWSTRPRPTWRKHARGSAEYAALASDSQRLEERIERYRTGVLMPAGSASPLATAAMHRTSRAS